MTKNTFEELIRQKQTEISRIEDEISVIEKEYALDALSRGGYSIGQRIEYGGKMYEIVGASIFVNPCPDGRLVLKNGELGKDVRPLYNIKLPIEK